MKKYRVKASSTGLVCFSELCYLIPLFIFYILFNLFFTNTSAIQSFPYPSIKIYNHRKQNRFPDIEILCSKNNTVIMQVFVPERLRNFNTSNTTKTLSMLYIFQLIIMYFVFIICNFSWLRKHVYRDTFSRKSSPFFHSSTKAHKKFIFQSKFCKQLSSYKKKITITHKRKRFLGKKYGRVKILRTGKKKKRKKTFIFQNHPT